MYVSGGYPLTEPELEALARLHGVPVSDSLLLAPNVNGTLERKGVHARVEVYRNADLQSEWFFVVVKKKQLPDISRADCKLVLDETDRERRIKASLGIESDFVSYLHVGWSNPVYTYVSEMGGDKSLVPHHDSS
jgi:hypothetical protein